MHGAGKLLLRSLHLGTAGLALLMLTAGCGAAKHDAALGVAVLSERRIACEAQTEGIAAAWREAVNSRYLEADVAIATFWASKKNTALKIAAETRGRQAADLLARIGKQRDNELRTAVIDLASQVDALCSFASDPSGFTIVTYNEKRSGLRVDLDRLFSRAQLLVGGAEIGKEKELFEEEVRAAAAAALAKAEALERKAAEEEAERAAEEKAAAEQAAFRQAEAKRAAAARVEMAQAAAEEARRATEQALAEEVEKRRQEAQAARSAQCRANWSWVSEHGPRLAAIGRDAPGLSCTQLLNEGRAISALEAKEPVKKEAADLGEALVSASTACSAKSSLGYQGALGRAQGAGARIERIMEECRQAAAPGR